MARRSSFGSIVNQSLKVMAREAARAERAAERERKALMREHAKQEKLNSRINKMEAACSFSGKLQALNVNFISLKRNFTPSHSLLNIKFVESFDKEILCDVINNLKVGDRIKAINCLKDETKLTYNEIILFISILENNIYKFIKENEGCWFDDKFGEYEFQPVLSLFDLDSDVDYDTAKSEVEIICIPTGDTETISGKDPLVVKKRINTSVERLNKKWIQQFNKYHLDRENSIICNIKEAQLNLLKYITTNSIDTFDYESLKDKSYFVSKLPQIRKPKLELIDLTNLNNGLLEADDNKPTEEKTEFLFWEKLLCSVGLKDKMEKRRNQRFSITLLEWENYRNKLIKEIESKKATNEEIKQKYDILQKEYENYLNNVQKEKEKFTEKQNIYNKTIDERVDNFKNKEATELEYYYKNSVMLSSYPIIWEKDIDLKYDATNKCITIDYKLPLLSEIYDIEKITYSVSKDEYTVTLAKDKQLKQDYNSILYQICLRTIYELFSIDSEINGINKITFNGNITDIDKATGKKQTTCILSLTTDVDSFESIELDNIDYYACFKKLNGISEKDLSTMTPINI